MGTKWAKRTDVELGRAQTGNNTGSMGHKARVEFRDNRNQVLSQLNSNASRATLAVGTKAVNLILWQMRQGYGKAIRDTGDLQRDVNYQVIDDVTVEVGNSLEYAPYVHDGTRKMAGRPYIQDALMSRDNQRKLQRVYEQYLKQGFGK